MAKSIHTRMRDGFGLARTYAEDGAFHSAARVLLGLSQEVKAHAALCDRELEKVLTGCEAERSREAGNG